MRALALACLLLAGAALGARAEGIWTALVLGTNEQPAKPAPKALSPYAKGLETVFGANTVYLLAARLQAIEKGREEWVVPTKQVFLKLRCMDRAPGAYTLQLELYVKQRLIVSSEVRLKRGAPLYIRGPAWGKGRLVFILEVQ